MVLHGFSTNDLAAQQILNELMVAGDADKIVSRVRQLKRIDDDVYYTLPGLPLCWKCTLKHIGQAISFASELENYPERIGCVVGELGHAFRECPDKTIAQHIHDAYQHVLDEGCVGDLTNILKEVVPRWRESIQSLQDSK